MGSSLTMDPRYPECSHCYLLGKERTVKISAENIKHQRGILLFACISSVISHALEVQDSMVLLLH